MFLLTFSFDEPGHGVLVCALVGGNTIVSVEPSAVVFLAMTEPTDLGQGNFPLAEWLKKELGACGQPGQCCLPLIPVGCHWIFLSKGTC